MPLSAMSATGPVCLIGMDATTLEGLKNRNRQERLFTAKCCGAPVQVRVVAGKVPHFYHLTTPTTCEGDRRETQEHLRLKAEVAAAASDAGWSVEVEAAERDESGRVVWQADVLATRGRARVAFEAQLSRPDWSEMLERQRRYMRSGVRGLWFVGTSKPFPVTNELPVFRTSNLEKVPTVHMRVAAEWPDLWEQVPGRGDVPLREFVASALGKRLVWAPYVAANAKDTECMLRVHFFVSGMCEGCHYFLCRPAALTLQMRSDPEYPRFVWHRDMPPQPTHWVPKLIELAKLRAQAEGKIAILAGLSGRCSYCGGDKSQYVNPGEAPSEFRVALNLGELPRARFGSREWAWLHRWLYRSERSQALEPQSVRNTPTR
jgi:hypothetical protein